MHIGNRWFFRRASAFVIDLLVVSLGVVLIALVLQTVTGISFKAPEIFRYTSCRNVDLVPAETFLAFGEDMSKGEHFQKICKTSNMGVISHFTTTIGIVLTAEGSTQRRSVHYASDSEGNPVQSFSLDWVVPFLAPFLFAFQLSRKRATIGKRVMSIKVIALDGLTPTLRAAQKREILKFLPLILYSIFEFMMAIYVFNQYTSGSGTPAEIVRELAPIVPDPFSLVYWMIPSAILSLATLIFYFGSFIRWRGQTFWDRFAGLQVTHS